MSARQPNLPQGQLQSSWNPPPGQQHQHRPYRRLLRLQYPHRLRARQAHHLRPHRSSPGVQRPTPQQRQAQGSNLPPGRLPHMKPLPRPHQARRRYQPRIRSPFPHSLRQHHRLPPNPNLFRSQASRHRATRHTGYALKRVMQRCCLQHATNWSLLPPS